MDLRRNCTSNLICASRSIYLFNTGLEACVHIRILNPFDIMAAEYSPFKCRCRYERFISNIDCCVDIHGSGSDCDNKDEDEDEDEDDGDSRSSNSDDGGHGDVRDGERDNGNDGDDGDYNIDDEDCGTGGVFKVMIAMMVMKVVTMFTRE